MGGKAGDGGSIHSVRDNTDAAATTGDPELPRKKTSWGAALDRSHHDKKVVGLADGLRRMNRPGPLEGSRKARHDEYNGDIPLEDDESYARSKVERRPVLLTAISYYTAVKIFVLYLISLNSLITVALSVGMTIYWHEKFKNNPNPKDLNGYNGSMDWILLTFAVITPLSLSIKMAFNRRELALIQIARFRSFAFQVYLAHCIWDWTKNGGKAGMDVDWMAHADKVLKELVSIGDELCRFLTLPSVSLSRHRMTKAGRQEAARTAEVAYRLYDSLYSRRFVKLSDFLEEIKLAGLGASEASRVRQYERYMGDAIENLRMLKIYRTPQTLRSFASLFTTLLPPFFAPTYADLAFKMDHLWIGIVLAVLASVVLNALFSGVEILEDPFVAFVTLDGIDVREELQVLHYQQLISARDVAFPGASPYGSPTAGVNTGEAPDGNALLSTEPSESPHVKFLLPPPLGNASEKSHRKRHSRLPSLGDAAFLVGLENEVDKRKSGYQVFQ